MITTKNKFFKFFLEAWYRFVGDSPPFFKILQVISSITAFIATIPDIMIQFDIKLPELWVPYYRQIIQVSAAVAFIISRFGLQNGKTVVYNRDGGQTVFIDNKLPFTAAIESKKAEKNENITVVQSVDGEIELPKN